METLDFLQTWSVEDFKAQRNVKSIEIKRNESTGKCFFSYGTGLSGAVSAKFEQEGIKDPVISEVSSPETGNVFLLLHARGEGATLLATL
jgi:hypothetical protein